MSAETLLAVIAWESLSLGDIAIALGLAGGGAGGLTFGRAIYSLARAITKAVGSWQANQDASTEAARAGTSLAPLVAEAVRTYIRSHNSEVPSEEPDSDELQVLRIAIDGDEADLARAIEHLARNDDPENTLTRKLTRTERRLMAILEAAREQRRARTQGGRQRATAWPPSSPITLVSTKRPGE